MSVSIDFNSIRFYILVVHAHNCHDWSSKCTCSFFSSWFIVASYSQTKMVFRLCWRECWFPNFNSNFQKSVANGIFQTPSKFSILPSVQVIVVYSLFTIATPFSWRMFSLVSIILLFSNQSS